MWPDRRVLDLFKTEFPIVQAPMAGVMDAELAKDQAYEFMFVLGQPRFRGGVQRMINPIAIR